MSCDYNTRTKKQEERHDMLVAVSNLEVKLLGEFSRLKDQVQPEGFCNTKIARRKYQIMEQSLES